MAFLLHHAASFSKTELRCGFWAAEMALIADTPPSPPPKEEKRDIRRISTRAPSVLVSCLLFYQAFRSRPSAPRRLICQMGFHLHLQDASNLPFIPTSPHRTVCQDGSKSSSATCPTDDRLQQWRTSVCVVLIALTRQNLFKKKKKTWFRKIQLPTN